MKDLFVVVVTVAILEAIKAWSPPVAMGLALFWLGCCVGSLWRAGKRGEALR